MTKFRVGDKVVWSGSYMPDNSYEGTVTQVHSDGMYTICWTHHTDKPQSIRGYYLGMNLTLVSTLAIDWRVNQPHGLT